VTPDLARAFILVSEFSKVHPFPRGQAYVHTEHSLFPVEVVPIEEVAPFARGLGVPGLSDERALSIIRAVSEGKPLPPVNVYRSANSGAMPSFKLYHGFHRYQLSIALGFTHIPVAVNPSDENNAL
jgi:hypothetical protein